MDKKISALDPATLPLAGTEPLPIVQSGVTVKVSSDDLTVKNIRSNATTGILQVAGPAAGTTRTMTVPNSNFTVVTSTDVIGIANGGTGQTTQQTALNALAGAVTSGSYLRGNGTNVLMASLGAADLTGTIPSTVLGNSSLFVGTTQIALNRSSGAQSLTGTSIDGNAGTVTNGVYTNGSYADPTWITSLAGSKITGNISGNAANVTGTVAVGNGGTGQTTYTDGQLLIGNSTGNTLTKATLTAGTGITITNGSGAITLATNGQLTGSAPVTATSNYTVAAGVTYVINNKAGSSLTVTLPAASTNSGRVLTFQNYQNQTVISNASNVVQLGGGAATTDILPAISGSWATIVSDGTNWIMMNYSSNNSLVLE